MKVYGYEVPQKVFDALCNDLDEGPATAAELVDVAMSAGAPRIGYTAHRIVDRWLQQQRKAGRIKFTAARKWSLAS
jgi:hypothetical protein